MSYAYVVTRIMHKTKEGVVDIPNLGVHSSYKKAMKHYQSVRADRAKTYGQPVTGQCVASTPGYPFERSTLLMSDHFPDEEIRLEKWKL